MMMRRSVQALSSYSQLGSSTTTGIPFLHSAVMGLFHSQPSNPCSTKSVEHEFHEMLLMNLLPHVPCFRQILAQLDRLEHYEAIIPLFKQMCLVGIAPDASTLNIVTNCYCHLKRAELCFPVLAFFFKLGLEPDPRTFTALIKAFLLQSTMNPVKRYEVIIPLFKHMCLIGIAPDASTLSIVTNCYCHLKQAHRLGLPVLALFFKLGLEPDLPTFAALIKAFLLQTMIEPVTSNSKLNYLDSAFLYLFHKMIRLRPRPRVILFNQILTGLVKLKHYSTVISLNKKMILRRIVPNDYTLNILINCYCHLNRMGFSLSILAQFFKWGLEPDAITFNTLTHGFVLDNQVPEAARMFTKMIEEGHRDPDVFTFNALIKGFCKTGNNSAAIHLLREMEKARCKPNIVSYNTIIDRLCKDGHIDEALKLFSEMSSKGITPNVVAYSSMIHGLCDNQRLSTAIEWLKEMEANKLELNIIVYNVVIEGLHKAGEIEFARYLFSGLASKGIQPDVITYTIMIHGLSHHGLIIEAEKLLREMGGRGCSPNDLTYNIFIQGLLKNNMTSGGVELIQEMVDQGFSANAFTMELIVGLLCKDVVDMAFLPLLMDS